MAKKKPDKYKNEFFPEFGHFLKEGIAQDFEFQDKLAKLLYFESSKTKTGEFTSLDEYISRLPADQSDIYYLCAPSRELAMQSPYYEAFKEKDKEVIFIYSAIDDFVMTNLKNFEGRKLISCEKGDLSLDDKNEEDDKDDEDESLSLSKAEAQELCAWIQMTLKDKVAKTKITTRLVGSPAVITDHESGALRRMMKLVDTNTGPSLGQDLPLQTLEINPKHPIMVGLDTIRKTQPQVAEVVAAQILDNCLVAAGIMDDGRSMLPRLNEILLSLVNDTKEKYPSPEESDSVSENKE